jgi:diaminohydroxyphosphoribosylaminopyrimidine deaminase/5-amino-6-(5-phosphoribosylamino)uracil reductase
VRGRVDAVIVGIGTALADDPDLTCRLARPRRVARRVVLDSRARLPVDSRLVRTARDAPVIVAVCDNAPRKRTNALMDLGCHVVQIPSDRGRVDVGSLLDLLGSLEMTNVLVEGGGEVLGSFLDVKEVDEVLAFVGPPIIGGEGKPPVAGVGAEKIADALRVSSLTARRLGDSVLLAGRLGID